MVESGGWGDGRAMKMRMVGRLGRRGVDGKRMVEITGCVDLSITSFRFPPTSLEASAFQVKSHDIDTESNR